MTHILGDILRWCLESVALALLQQGVQLGLRWLVGVAVGG